MAFSEQERVWIRLYMGWPPGHTEPRYDSQIQRVQSHADGGVMPDSSTEDAIRLLLGRLNYPTVGTALPNGRQSIEEQLLTMQQIAMVGSADEATIDPPRGIMMLRSEGRRIVSQMAVMLEAPPLIDAFSGSVARPGPTSYIGARSLSHYGA